MGDNGSQMAFRDLEIQEKSTRTKTIASELDRRFKAVALSIDRRELSVILDVSYSYVCEILNTNGDQKRFKSHHIPALILEKPDLFIEEVVGFVCELAGYEKPEKKQPRAPEEEIALIRRRLRAHGLEAFILKDL